jgi:hypothetical protein
MLDRRTALKLLASAPAAAGFAWSDAEVAAAHAQVGAARRTAAAFKPAFFTPHEYRTVRVLVDLIIPKDDRSGSATDAGVPEFMDFIMSDQPPRQVAMRGGLAWLDRACEERFAQRFVACTDAQRRAVLDALSGPDPVPELPPAEPGAPRPLRKATGLSHGVAFFRSFRDLTATGFWTSRMGIADLQYIGNTFVREWKGCPAEALKKLGVGDPA